MRYEAGFFGVLQWCQMKKTIWNNNLISVVNESLIVELYHSKEDLLGDFSRPPRHSDILPDDWDGAAVIFPLPLRRGLKYIGVIMSSGNSPLSLRRFRNISNIVRDLFEVWRLVPAQDVNFFYTRSHLSVLQSCAFIFSANFQFIFTFK